MALTRRSCVGAGISIGIKRRDRLPDRQDPYRYSPGGVAERSNLGSRKPLKLQGFCGFAGVEAFALLASSSEQLHDDQKAAH